MKHKILLLLFLFSLLPSWGWGQETDVPVTINLGDTKYNGGFTIEKKGTYIFTGTYKGTPAQEIGNGKKAVINVKAGLYLEVTIILSKVEIDLSSSDGCPLSAKDAETVNLKLKGKNTLIVGMDCPGIWAPEGENCGIIIDEESGSSGSLRVKLIRSSYPGIGGEYNQSKNGYITINGGTINATGVSGAGIGGANRCNSSKITITGGTVISDSGTGAGIGSGAKGSESEITITGGTITAFSGWGAGIGSGEYDSTAENVLDCKITITGGIVTATSLSGAGIGSGENSTGSNITITGGTVTASSTYGAGIGDGYYDTNTSSSTFSTGASDGTAFIKATGGSKSISDDTYRTNKTTKGLIFDGSYGNIYGDSYTLTADATIENGKILTIKKNQTLTINDGFKLTNNGVINCEGKIVGTIENNHEIQYLVTYNFCNEDSPTTDTEYISSGSNISPHNVTRKFYTFDGWYDKPETGNKVEIISEAITVYAHWKPIPFTIKTPIDDITTTYGASFTKEFTADMFSDDISNAGDLKSIELKELQTLPDGLSFNKSILSGTPTEVNESGTNITFVVTAVNGYSNEVTIPFKVNKAPLTITLKPDQKLFEDEIPAYEVTGAVMGEDPILTGSLAIQNGKVVINDLQLEAPFSDNYTLSLSPEVPITIINNETAKSLVQLNGTTNANGAYIDEVTVTAPDGFLIALESSSLKSTLIYTKSFMWNQKGTYDLKYRLKRISGDKESNDFSMEITVVESQYIPDNGGNNNNDNNDSLIKEYNIEIPEVEGISVDEGFGNHWIKDWVGFSFIITVKEGYVENSDPEVTIKGYDFEFDALTDTTYECKIDHVYKNAEVTITGIIKDPATANTAIKAPEESWKIMNGVAYITVAKPTIFKVVEINGNITIYNLSPGVTPIYNLPKANVLLFSFDGKKAEKVIISNR